MGIKVPRPPKSAYNPQRKPGLLLQSQIRHLEWATRPAAERRQAIVPKVRTEAEAAARIEQLTLKLRQQTSERPAVIKSTSTKGRKGGRGRRGGRGARG